MKDVAQAVGVAPSTVSRVLNGAAGHIPIARETQARILDAVQQLGYRPDPLARGLRGASTALFGLIVREIADPFFAGAIEIVAREARRQGYSLVLGHAQSSGDEALALKEILETRHCDGLILLGDVKHVPDIWADLGRSALPLIAMCQGSRTPGIHTINTDNRRGVNMALDYLHGLGHRRIAYLDAGWPGDVAERLDAYRDWMHQRDLPVSSGYLQPGQNNPESGLSAFERVMALREPPSALMCATDQVAFGALSGALKIGLTVPTDISIVGFDDIAIAPFAAPPLTTVRQPMSTLARMAVETLVGLVREDPTSAPQLRVCDPELIVRASCQAFKGRQDA